MNRAVRVSLEEAEGNILFFGHHEEPQQRFPPSTPSARRSLIGMGCLSIRQPHAATHTNSPTSHCEVLDPVRTKLANTGCMERGWRSRAVGVMNIPT